MPCGRRCQVLYGPLPVMTAARFLDDGEGLAVDGLAGRWHPGARPAGVVRWSFACSACWKVWNFTLADYRGWNELVMYLSGGLLYGREVERPGWVAFERKQERRRGVRRTGDPDLRCAQDRRTGERVG